MLEVRNLFAGYGEEDVLRDVSLAFPQGHITAVVGPNGGGKSTLLKAVVGLTRTRGSLSLTGEPLEGSSRRELARHIAYLPQSRPLPQITVEALVLHGRFPYLSYPRTYRREDREAAKQALEALGIAGLADRSLDSLSGGQRQKAYIAMALAQDTEVVLMDEPTNFLDISQRLRVLELARLLADRGKAVVLVVHDLNLALRGADRLAVIAGGQLLAQGEPEAVFTSGILDRAFSTHVKRVMTEDGWQYYCPG